MVAAGAVVAPGTVVKSGEIWGGAPSARAPAVITTWRSCRATWRLLPAGNPAVFLRKLKPEEAKFLPESAKHYARLAAEHAAETGKSIEQIARDRGLLDAAA